MDPINVLIVDDSAFMRKLLSEFLSEDPAIRVVGSARNGRDALRKVKMLAPDVVTLDVELPDINGIDVLRSIMKEEPLPVVMVSNFTQRGAKTTLDAMAIGAVDVVAKPSGVISPDLHLVKEELLVKVKTAASANIKGQVATIQASGKTTSKPVLQAKDGMRLIAIGASTGGPRALQTVIGGLPDNLPAPVVVVQHLPPLFTTTLAERLNGLTPLTVKEAEHGEILQNGTVYIAPGGYHMKLKNNDRMLTVVLEDSAPVHGLKPAFDSLLESLAGMEGLSLVLAVLTGMGNDGARGLSRFNSEYSPYAIAESAETAVVFGMPKAAIGTGRIHAVLPLPDIAQAIANHFHI